MGFPFLNNSGWSMPGFVPEAAPVGGGIFPIENSGIDQFGLNQPQGITPLSTTPEAVSINSMVFPNQQAFASNLAVSPSGLQCPMPPALPSGQSKNSKQLSELMDFMKGIFSGLMFNKLAQQ